MLTYVNDAPHRSSGTFDVSAPPAALLAYVSRCADIDTSTIMQSVVKINQATEAAFCSALRVTLVGSITPICMRSAYSPVLHETLPEHIAGMEPWAGTHHIYRRVDNIRPF